MNIADMIPRRRSVRAYRAERIDNAVLADLLRRMEALVPLIPGAKVAGRIIPTDHGSFLQKWKTPHFIAVFSDGSDDGLLNAGFMYQQLGCAQLQPGIPAAAADGLRRAAGQGLTQEGR